MSGVTTIKCASCIYFHKDSTEENKLWEGSIFRGYNGTCTHLEAYTGYQSFGMFSLDCTKFKHKVPKCIRYWIDKI